MAVACEPETISETDEATISEVGIMGTPPPPFAEFNKLQHALLQALLCADEDSDKAASAMPVSTATTTTTTTLSVRWIVVQTADETAAGIKINY